MNHAHPDEARLRDSLRSALAAAEPARAPEFGHLWTRASAGGRARGLLRWRPAAAAVAICAVAFVAWLARPPVHDDPDADYRLALAVVAAHGRGTPTDAWLDELPSSQLSGLPDVPQVEYPLMPEETLL